jgi:hypothetical protein
MERINPNPPIVYNETKNLSVIFPCYANLGLIQNQNAKIKITMQNAKLILIAFFLSAFNSFNTLFY